MHGEALYASGRIPHAASRIRSTIRASLGGTNRAPATSGKARYGGLFRRLDPPRPGFRWVTNW